MLAERLMVALDVPTGADALRLAQTLQSLNVGLKLGMQLFYREGVTILSQLQALTPLLFVDLKLHDIPNTVASASESLVANGVQFFNVHTLGGGPMMRAAADRARTTAEALGRPKPLVIGVTVLTSHSVSQLQEQLRVGLSLEDYVVHLAWLAQESGLDGVVCSAQEAAKIRKACGPEFLLVTPGIRPVGSVTNDQSRIVTPSDAIQAGADYLVVGRPITQAPDPLQAAQAILEEMRQALKTAGRGV